MIPFRDLYIVASQQRLFAESRSMFLIIQNLWVITINIMGNREADFLKTD